MPFAIVKNVVQIAFLPQRPLIYDCIYFCILYFGMSGKMLLILEKIMVCPEKFLYVGEDKHMFGKFLVCPENFWR